MNKLAIFVLLVALFAGVAVRIAYTEDHGPDSVLIMT